MLFSDLKYIFSFYSLPFFDIASHLGDDAVKVGQNPHLKYIGYRST